MKHRWVEKTVVSPYKTERLCLHCGLIKVSRHETEGGRDRHWTEFWRGLDQIEGSGAPVCEPARADA